MMNHLDDQKGIALVVTLLALVLITAMVVEFSYAVYTGTQNLYNWRDSQRLSIMAKSGINVSAKYISDPSFKGLNYTEPVELPVENPFEDFEGIITVRIEDENAKFYINSIVPENQIVRTSDSNSPYNIFRRLLKTLSLDEKIADRVRDWIDRDSEAELSDSEVNVKNDALASIDELLLIKGISREDYEKIMPYITAHGDRNAPQVNINRAEKTVLKALFSGITDDLVQRIILERKSKPFENIGQLQIILGNIDIPAMTAYEGEIFLIRSSASSGGVKRIIETVLNTEKQQIEYWKEY